QLSTEFNLSRETLQQQLKQNRQEQQPRQDAPPPAPTTNPMVFTPPTRQQPKTQVEKAQELLLYRLFHDSTLNHRFRA
ncbi:DNA primase, partial [Enterococcus faecalis]|nr:DNA primase [Enterococcus faecalis]